jgi:hypothetical protein
MSFPDCRNGIGGRAVLDQPLFARRSSGQGFVLDLLMVIFNPKDLMVVMDYICTEDDLHFYHKMKFPDIFPMPNIRFENR